MKLIALIVLLLTLCSCSSIFDVAKLPRDKPAAIAKATTAALATPDLDLDGYVNGLVEWEVFVRRWVQAYQDSRK